MSERSTSDARPVTVGEALDYCCRRLENGNVFFGHGTDNPWDESVQLVLSVCDLPPDSDDSVLPHPFDQQALEQLEHLLRRRIEERVPAPYLLGRAWFAGLEFLCDERAIIPRSPIAELILHDFKPWYAGSEPVRILDLCCGGGCIGLAAAHYNPGAAVDLVDIDPAALELARENARFRQVEQRVEILASDLFSELSGRRYDIILSNPPYVDAGDLAAMPREFGHEPELALGSGPDGLALARRILADAGDYLRDGGLLVVEVGNSWVALEEAYPDVPFTWLEFEHGGHGVFALTAKELQSYRESLAG
jgi:ribosomal protein L3 glutamine methyltransferase